MRVCVLRRNLTPLGLVLVLVGAGVADPPPLIDAAKSGDWESVRILLEQGADVGAAAPDGATAIRRVSRSRSRRG